MSKQTIQDIDVKGKRVLVRVDFNVPLNDGRVIDDTRIREALPTIQYLLEQQARVILLSHLGRPKGKVVEKYRLDPVAEVLARLLKKKIQKVNDCIGPAVKKAIENLQTGEVLMLENTRFHSEEITNDPAFAAELASYGDIFIQEAFGVVHRDQASVVGIAKHLKTVAGFLVKKEIDELGKLFQAPKKPLVLVIGGAKIDTKIGILRAFLPLADTILLGGGLANTFLAAEGFEIGKSLYEENKLEIAREILMEAAQLGDKLILPSDVVCADATAEPTDNTPTVDLHTSAVSCNLSIYDIGIETRQQYAELIQSAGTVIWNGPLGYFEKKPFAGGTQVVATACAQTMAETLLGGGDTITALKQFKIDINKFTHVSTGGGAMLEFLEGKQLPGLAVIQKA